MTESFLALPSTRLRSSVCGAVLRQPLHPTQCSSPRSTYRLKKVGAVLRLSLRDAVKHYAAFGRANVHKELRATPAGRQTRDFAARHLADAWQVVHHVHWDACGARHEEVEAQIELGSLWANDQRTYIVEKAGARSTTPLTPPWP